MIFTIPFETFKTLMPLEQGIIYYYEDETHIDLYLPQGIILLKSTYLKQGTEQDLIWKDDNLKKAMRILSVEKQDINLKVNVE